MDKYLLNVLRKKMSSMGKPLLPLYKVTKTVFKDRTAFIGPAELKNIDPSFDAQMNLDLARDVKETICRLAEITLNDQVEMLSIACKLRMLIMCKSPCKVLCFRQSMTL